MEWAGGVAVKIARVSGVRDRLVIVVFNADRETWVVPAHVLMVMDCL